jgi:hypothetical protein
MDTILCYGVIAVKFSDKQKEYKKKDHRNITHVFMITFNNQNEPSYPGELYDKNTAITLMKTNRVHVMRWSYESNHWQYITHLEKETVGKEEYVRTVKYDDQVKAEVTDVLPNLLDYRYFVRV